MRTIVALLFACSMVFGTSLTGTLKDPAGNGITGYLFLSLSRQAALASTGGCGGPAQIVPNPLNPMKIVVTAGALVGFPTVFGNDCMLPQGTYYNVTAKDNNGNILFTDKWIIQGSTQNIGSVISVVVSGTTDTIGGVGVVLTTPAGNQTVTQPPATAMIFNALNITTSLSFPDGGGCNTTYCQFGGTTAFINGLGTGPSSSSVIYVGPGGTLVNRTITGTDYTCSGQPDGWQGIRLDNHKLELCAGGHTYGIALAFIL